MYVFNRIVESKLLTYLIVIVTCNCIHLIYWKYIIRECLIYGVSFFIIFVGVLSFIVTDLIWLVILITFPMLALWLPSHM